MKGLSDPNATIHLPNIDRLAFPCEDNLEPYVGNPYDTTSDMNQANIDGVVNEAVNDLLDTVLKNPFANKLLKETMSVLSRVISAADQSSPLKFKLDQSIVANEIQLVEDVANDIESLFVNVTDDAVDFLIDQIVDDIEDPQQTFSNFASGVGQFMEQIETDTINALYVARCNYAAP